MMEHLEQERQSIYHDIILHWSNSSKFQICWAEILVLQCCTLGTLENNINTWEQNRKYLPKIPTEISVFSVQSGRIQKYQTKIVCYKIRVNHSIFKHFLKAWMSEISYFAIQNNKNAIKYLGGSFFGGKADTFGNTSILRVSVRSVL